MQIKCRSRLPTTLQRHSLIKMWHRSAISDNTSAAVSLDVFCIKVYKCILYLLYFINRIDRIPISAIILLFNWFIPWTDSLVVLPTSFLLFGSGIWWQETLVLLKLFTCQDQGLHFAGILFHAQEVLWNFVDEIEQVITLATRCFSC